MNGKNKVIWSVVLGIKTGIGEDLAEFTFARSFGIYWLCTGVGIHLTPPLTCKVQVIVV